MLTIKSVVNEKRKEIGSVNNNMPVKRMCFIKILDSTTIVLHVGIWLEESREVKVPSVNVPSRLILSLFI